MNNIGPEIAAALIAVHSNEGPKTVDAHIALYLEALSKLSARRRFTLTKTRRVSCGTGLDRLVAKGGAA
jgi:hypothetical protein